MRGEAERRSERRARPLARRLSPPLAVLPRRLSPSFRYDAKAAWSASLALSRQRLAGGGRGCSLPQSGAPAAATQRAASGAAVAADDEAALQWFGGGANDADAAARPSHAHGGAGWRGKRNRAAGAAGAAGSVGREGGAAGSTAGDAAQGGTAGRGATRNGGQEGEAAAGGWLGGGGLWDDGDGWRMLASVAASGLCILVASVSKARRGSA